MFNGYPLCPIYGSSGELLWLGAEHGVTKEKNIWYYENGGKIRKGCFAIPLTASTPPLHHRPRIPCHAPPEPHPAIRLAFGLGGTRMVGGGGGPLLRTGMPVSGFWNAASWHLSPRIYHVVPDQKQSVGVEEPISFTCPPMSDLWILW